MPLAAGHRRHHSEGLGPRGDLVRQRVVDRVERDVLPAGEEADEIPPLRRSVIADRPAQDRIARLQRVENGALRGQLLDFE